MECTYGSSNRKHETKRIWLTFDDGPHPYNTDRILRKLDTFNIKATFFVVGRNARTFKRLVQQTFAAGHRIGNHSYTHFDLTTLTEEKVRDEIEWTDEVIADCGGSDKIFRPPYGHTNATIRKVASELGYRIALWNVDTLDWDRNYQPMKWVQHAVTQIRLRNKSKVLNHDIHKTTADSFDAFISSIGQLGNATFEPPSTL